MYFYEFEVSIKGLKTLIGSRVVGYCIYSCCPNRADIYLDSRIKNGGGGLEVMRIESRTTLDSRVSLRFLFLFANEVIGMWTLTRERLAALTRLFWEEKKKGICITLGLVNRDLLKDLNVSVRNEFDFLREDWWVQDLEFRITIRSNVYVQLNMCQHLTKPPRQYFTPKGYSEFLYLDTINWTKLVLNMLNYVNSVEEERNLFFKNSLLKSELRLIPVWYSMAYTITEQELWQYKPIPSLKKIDCIEDFKSEDLVKTSFMIDVYYGLDRWSVNNDSVHHTSPYSRLQHSLTSALIQYRSLVYNEVFRSFSSFLFITRFGIDVGIEEKGEEKYKSQEPEKDQKIVWLVTKTEWDKNIERCLERVKLGLKMSVTQDSRLHLMFVEIISIATVKNKSVYSWFYIYKLKIKEIKQDFTSSPEEAFERSYYLQEYLPSLILPSRDSSVINKMYHLCHKAEVKNIKLNIETIKEKTI